jgi:putative flippase GtrA
MLNAHPWFQRRLPRFLVAGGIATLLHWLIMWLLVQAGLAPAFSTAAGATAGLAFNYLAQHQYAFASDLPHRVALPRYLAAANLGWGLNLLCFSVLSLAGFKILAAQFFATATATLANFFFAKRFVFHEKPTLKLP